MTTHDEQPYIAAQWWQATAGQATINHLIGIRYINICICSIVYATSATLLPFASHFLRTAAGRSQPASSLGLMDPCQSIGCCWLLLARRSKTCEGVCEKAWRRAHSTMFD